MTKPGPKPKLFECEEKHFWYLVGLVATDGCLLSNRAAVAITSKDRAYLEQLRKSLKLGVKIQHKKSGFGQTTSYDLVIKRRAFYDKLLETGLTPRKTATMGKLNVAKHGFSDFLRGVIDGDGSIRNWIHPSNGCKQWSLRIYGVSSSFLKWIAQQTEALWGVKGVVHEEKREGTKRLPKYVLKYGKLSAKIIFKRAYYPNALSLERKKQLANTCLVSSVGWLKSKATASSGDLTGWEYSRAKYGSKVASH